MRAAETQSHVSATVGSDAPLAAQFGAEYAAEILQRDARQRRN